MTEWDLAYMRRKVEPQGLTDADIDAIADAVSIDNRATTWHRRFARAVLAAQPLHEQLREMGEAHAAQPAPVPVPLTGHVYLVQWKQDGTQCIEAFADRSAAVAYANNIGSHAYVACVAIRTPEYVRHVFGIAASPEVKP
jgi:hypothetical protein